jgi:beta-galactosidase
MFYFGVDYYPEQWPEERWSIDAQLMKEACFNVARLAEFAWSKMEPSEGNYDFDWLDRAIDILHAHGMQIVLGTPTASAPPWLMKKNPELFRVREDGQRVTFGNRREYCPNHPLYQEHTRRIVTKMAEHYAHHPAVIGWQIDNEFGERCYCPVCTTQFQTWLRGRYEALDDLNQKWGTAFWSHSSRPAVHQIRGWLWTFIVSAPIRTFPINKCKLTSCALCVRNISSRII